MEAIPKEKAEFEEAEIKYIRFVHFISAHHINLLILSSSIPSVIQLHGLFDISGMEDFLICCCHSDLAYRFLYKDFLCRIIFQSSFFFIVVEVFSAQVLISLLSLLNVSVTEIRAKLLFHYYLNGVDAFRLKLLFPPPPTRQEL
ncbi:hypothetical protein HRI_002298000 [Hibiscus trionum]|uniref:Uncharacterized protein n=1 Tax=Hibiscus trionum TaxID=183268 RepID=A0A9W7HZK3_HIBTR|nr:hypothetical protein HRI_002298000 [Hibiscus trionum]